MRTILLAFTALILVVAPGCGNDSTTPAADLAMTPADMAVAIDMAKFQTCSAALSCVVGCSTNVACATACQANTSATANQYLLPFELCLFATCGPGDGGMNKCMMAGDMSAMCLQCVGNAFVGASNAGGACHSEYAACVMH
jgi:hypothetical protein